MWKELFNKENFNDYPLFEFIRMKVYKKRGLPTPKKGSWKKWPHGPPTVSLEQRRL